MCLYGPFLVVSEKGDFLMLTRFGAGLTWSIDSDFDRLVVRRHLKGRRAYHNRERKTLSAPAATDEPQVVKLGDLILHDGGAVAKFCAIILVVSRPQGDHGAVLDVVQGDHLEGDRQALVAPPVVRKGAAEDGRASGLHQLPVVLLEGLLHIRVHVDAGRRKMHRAPVFSRERHLAQLKIRTARFAVGRRFKEMRVAVVKTRDVGSSDDDTNRTENP